MSAKDQLEPQEFLTKGANYDHLNASAYVDQAQSDQIDFNQNVLHCKCYTQIGISLTYPSILEFDIDYKKPVLFKKGDKLFRWIEEMMYGDLVSKCLKPWLTKTQHCMYLEQANNKKKQKGTETLIQRS